MPDEALLEPTTAVNKAADAGSPAPDPKPDDKPKPKPQRNQAIDELRELFSKPKSDKPEGEDDAAKAKKDDKQPDDAAKEGGTAKPEGKGGAQAKDDKAKEGDAKDEKPKKLRKVEQPAPRQVDEEKLAEAVARATAKAIGEQKPVETKPSDDFSDLPKSRRNDIPIYEKLGKKDDFIRFSRAEVRYIDQWEKEHPGEKFDPDADEHESFYSKHEPDVDASDFRQAEIEIAADRIVEKRIQEKLGSTSKELEELRTQQSLVKAEPEMARASQQIVGSIIEAIDKDLLKAIEEGGAEKVEERDLVAHDVIKAIAPRAAAVVREAVRIFATDGRAIDQANPVHNEVVSELVNLEQRLSKLPPEQLDWDGRGFLTREKFNKLPADKQRAYWCVGLNELETHLAAKYSAEAKSTYDFEKTRAERYAARLGKTATNSTVSNNGKHEEEADEATEKPNSPSSGTRAAVNPANKTDVKPSKTLGDLIEKAMLGTLK